MESPLTQTQAQPPLPPLPPLPPPPPAPTQHPRQPSGSPFQPPSSHLSRRNSNHGSASSHSSSSSSPSPHRRLAPRRQTSDLVLPEWQPDESVTRCPICLNGFTFFNRRHHCRKCGRVVCNPCSPHRITIPKAFVVRPTLQTPCYQPPPLQGHLPDSPEDADYEDNMAGPGRLVSAQAAQMLHWNSSSGDEDEAMQVRICDQCLGRRPSDSHHIPGRSVPGPIPGTGGGGAGGWMSGFLGGEDHAAMGVPTTLPGNRDVNRRRRQSIQSGRSLPHIHHPAMSPGSRSAYMNYQSPPQNHHFYSPASSSNSLPSRHAQQPYYPPAPYRPSRNSSQNVSPRPRLKETDYCPVCTHALPPVDPNGHEDAREEHIQSCIRAVEFSASSVSGTPADAPNPPAMLRARRYTGGGRMVVWKASEKDTWASSEVSEKADSEREKAECVICFEEFEVGDVIARLECLCRYHKKCIRMWFDKKGNGECPVHAVHE